MSKTYIPADLRQQVTQRAERCCEYCLIHEDDSYYTLQIDHVVSEKHGGHTQEDNLALACAVCNRTKGSDVGSVDWETGAFMRFYNPRTDRWREHFDLDEARITPLTDIARVTERLLQLNVRERLLEREILRAIGRYPPWGGGQWVDEGVEV